MLLLLLADDFVFVVEAVSALVSVSFFFFPVMSFASAFATAVWFPLAASDSVLGAVEALAVAAAAVNSF